MVKRRPCKYDLTEAKPESGVPQKFDFAAQGVNKNWRVIKRGRFDDIDLLRFSPQRLVGHNVPMISRTAVVNLDPVNERVAS